MATHTITTAEADTTTLITMEMEVVPTVPVMPTEDLAVKDPKVEDPKITDPIVSDPIVPEPEADSPKIQDPNIQDHIVQDHAIDNPELEDFIVHNHMVDSPKLDDPGVECFNAHGPTPDVKTASRKRTHSHFTSDLDAPGPMPPTRALLIHMPTLLDCTEAITAVVRALIFDLRPEVDPRDVTEESVQRAFATNSYLPDIINSLGFRTLEEWEVGRLFYIYQAVYNREGLPRFRLAPGARELLEAANSREDIPLVAVLSSNPEVANQLLSLLGLCDALSQVSQPFDSPSSPPTRV